MIKRNLGLLLIVFHCKAFFGQKF